MRTQLEELLFSVRTNLTRAFASDEYGQRRRGVLEKGQEEAQPLIEEAEKQAEEAGFQLRFTPTGVNLIPTTDGKPMTPEEFTALDASHRREIEERQQPITEKIEQVREKLRSIESTVNDQLRKLDREIAEWVMSDAFDKLIKEYGEHAEVVHFLEQLKEFTLRSADMLRAQSEQAAPPLLPPAVEAMQPVVGQPDPFVAFRCNVFVDNLTATGPPIILEPNPSWTNLFGRIDRKAYLGTYLSDHTMLKPGSVHVANGGYLILNLVDLMSKPGAWDGLKRVIRTKEVRLEDPMEQYGLLTPQTLRPEPIPGGPEARRDRRPDGVLPALGVRRGVLGDVQSKGGLRLPDRPHVRERAGLRRIRLRLRRARRPAPFRARGSGRSRGARQPDGGRPGEALGALRASAGRARGGRLLGGRRTGGARWRRRTSSERSTSGSTG